MKIFDSNNQKEWSGNNFEHMASKKGLLLKSRGGVSASIRVPAGSGNIKIIGRKRTGDGSVNIEINNSNKTIFNDKITFNKSSLSEFNLPFKNNTNFISFDIKIFRNINSVGSIYIDRISIVSQEKKLIKTSVDRKRDGRRLQKKIISGDNIKIESNSVDDINKAIDKVKSTGRKKIAFIVPYNICGGAEIYIKNIIDNLNSDIFSCHILMLKKNIIQNLICVKNINFSYLPSKSQLKANLIANSYDYIVYYNSHNVYETLTSLVEKREIRSCLYEIYHSDFEWSDSLSRVKERKNVSGIFAISDGLANDISFSGTRDTLRVGIDLKKFNKNNESAISSDKMFNNKNKVIGVVSRLSREKNIDYIIDLASMSNFNFIIVGDGPQKSQLVSKANELGLDNVHFAGFIRNTQEYYRAFDAFICSSKCSEGTPVSILEAMASGIPVFAIMAGQISTIVRDRSTGFEIIGDPSEDCFEITKIILKNSNLVSKVAKLARRFVEKNHDITDVVDIFTKVILSSDNTQAKISEEQIKDVLIGYYA